MVLVIDRLHWMNSVLGPLLQQAVRRAERIDIMAIVAQMLQMGDGATTATAPGP